MTAVYLTAAWQQEVAYVVPDHVDKHSYTKCNTNECYNLTELIRQNVGRSNLEISFLPGTHTAQVEGAYQVETIANLSLSAANLSLGAMIDCNFLVGFVFVSVTNLQINGLTFESCSFLQDSIIDDIFYISVYIEKSENVSISNVSIRNGLGTGLFVESAWGSFTISWSEFMHNKLNFYFQTEELKETVGSNYTNLTVTDSVFTHGMEVHNYYTWMSKLGIMLKLLQRNFNVVAHLRNITIMNNYLHNLVIELNICMTNLTIENLFSSNSESGLSLIVVSSYCNIDARGIVNVKNASFVNTTISAVNEESDSVLSCFLYSGELTMYWVVFTNISIKGSHLRKGKLLIYNPSKFSNLQIEMHNSTFEKTSGMFVHNSVIMIEEQFLYQRNSVGVVLLTTPSCNSNFRASITLRKGSIMIFTNNTVKSGHKSILHATNSVISMNHSSTMTFEYNNGSTCGGMRLVKTNITFSGPGEKYLNFSHNQGSTGGALALFDGSQLQFDCGYTKLWFISNEAYDKGGAIYVHDLGYVHNKSHLKPFYTVAQNCQRQPVSVYFKNNTALKAGSALYGGELDSYQSIDPFSHLENSKENPSLVSSDPIRVCLCTLQGSPHPSLKPDCNITEKSFEIIPGQSLEFPVVTVGRRWGVVSSVVYTHNKYSDRNVEFTQKIGLQCTKFVITLRSSAKKENIRLLNNARNPQVNTLNGPVTWNPNSQSEQLAIMIYFQECPPGFYFHNDKKRCACLPALRQKGIQCNFTFFKVLRPSPKWINATFEHNLNNLSTGVIVHKHCPFDYCKHTNEELPLSLDNPDKQCAFNRTGILCGACQSHLSQVLGTSKCKKCLRPWIVLIIPVMAVAGMALVGFLIILNLTVSVGSISGLIFYANIVRANNAVFFPPGVSNSLLGKFNSFLSTFIAWLNLDLGIEACLYDGLTAYAKTWLQFFFPFYIWLLVTVIIVASHYSSRASRLSGNNAVQVLATLFLLSYAKLLRLIITIFSFAELVYPDGYHRRVWLYDGNVDYLRGKHIPLFIAALLLLIMVSVPFTALLFSIQWLQRWSAFRVLLRLKPLFDAYTGPYKIKHRYWTGLLLLVRACLFLSFSLYSLNDPTTNLLDIVIVTFGLLTYISLIGGVYKLWFLNLLENVFILNLGILSATVGFYRQDNAGLSIAVPAITCTFVGISFVLFAVIVLCHLVLKLSKSERVYSLKSYMTRRMTPSDEGSEMLETGGSQLDSQEVGIVVTQSVVEMESDDLNEPFLH